MKFIKTFAIIGSIMMMVGCCGKNERQAIPTDQDLEKRVKEIVSNMTLEEKVGQMAEIGIDILGNSTSGVAEDIEFILKEDVLDSLMRVYKIGSVLNAPGKALSASEWNRVIEKINEAQPDVLFVCLGAPKQEKFIKEHFEELDVTLMLGLGGSLDGYAGVAQRAPKWMIDLSLEWLYRLLKEPKRLGRMMRLPKFVLACGGEKLRRKRNG